MEIKKIAVLVVAMGVAQVSFAAGSGGDRLVKNINVTESGFVQVTGDTPFANPDSCDNATKFFVDPAASPYKTWMAQILTAAAAGNKICPYFIGCFTWSGVTYPKMAALHFRN